MLLNVVRGEFAAQFPKFRGRHFALPTEFFLHLRLDRQAVAIPPGHVRRVMPRHALGLDNQIFEDFVQSGAEMDFPRRIRRPIMQHKEGLALTRFQDALVNIPRIPGFELLRLVLGQAGLHREVRLGQVQCLFEFKWFGHGLERRISLLLLVFLCLRCRPFVQVHGGKHRKAVEPRMLQ